MPTHVIINLAESTDAPTGVTSKVKDALKTQGKKTERYGFFWCKSRVVNNATIHKYDLVEAFDEGKERYGATIEQINDMKLKCDVADSVFYCAHGAATDVNVVFTQRANRIERLTDVARFSGFARHFLSTNKTHDLRLIVCFAGRSDNPDQQHTQTFLSSGSSNHIALKSSLAYKFYKDLYDNGVKTKMYARLGEVRIDPSSNYDMDILTQTEEGVIAGLELNGASQTEQRLGALVSDKRQMEIRLKYQNDIDLGVLTTVEKNWLDAYKETLRLNDEKKKQGTVTGQGRLLYEAVGTDLCIKFEGSQIYKGAFF